MADSIAIDMLGQEVQHRPLIQPAFALADESRSAVFVGEAISGKTDDKNDI